MDYRILTGGNFFRCVSQNTDDADIRSAYDDFSQAIFDSYVHADNPHGLLFSLIYAEAELQSLHDTFSDKMCIRDSLYDYSTAFEARHET